MKGQINKADFNGYVKELRETFPQYPFKREGNTLIFRNVKEGNIVFRKAYELFIDEKYGVDPESYDHRWVLH